MAKKNNECVQYAGGARARICDSNANKHRTETTTDRIASKWMERMVELAPMDCMSKPAAPPPCTEVLRGRLYLCGLMDGELYRAVNAYARPGERFTVVSLMTAHDLQSCRFENQVVRGPLYDQVRRQICSAAGEQADDTPPTLDDIETGPGTYVSVAAAERYAILCLTSGGTRAKTESLVARLLSVNTDRPQQDFDHVYVHMNDGTAESAIALTMRLPLLVRQIDEAIAERGEKVFVHCRVGVSRSVSVVLAYIAARAAAYAGILRPPIALYPDHARIVRAALACVRLTRPRANPWGAPAKDGPPEHGYINAVIQHIASPSWTDDTVETMARTHNTIQTSMKDQSDSILRTFGSCVVPA